MPGYRIGREIGKGGLGAVYAAVRNSDGQRVAVKTLLSRVPVHDTDRNEFFQQLDPLKQLRHPHIATLWEYGSNRNAFFFVYEYCNGQSLAEWLHQRNGRLTLHEAWPFMAQCLDALECAQASDLIHGELKPRNILVQLETGVRRAKLSDFGLARSFERLGFSGMTVTGKQAVACEFMPRERLTGFADRDPTSDLWSLMAIFYHMLTGDYPLEFGDRDPMEVILDEEPVPIQRRESSVPRTVAEVVDRALSNDRANRYSSASSLRTALQEACAVL